MTSIISNYETLSVAERLYAKMKLKTKLYQQKHPEKRRQYQMNYLARVKVENPEQHEKNLQRKRDWAMNNYYKKKEAQAQAQAQAQANQSQLTTIVLV